MVHRRKRVQLVIEKHAQLQAAQWVGVDNASRKARLIFGRNQTEGGTRAKNLAPFRSLRALCQRADRGVLENVLQRETPAVLLSAGKDDDAANGVPAQLEKVVIDPNPVDPEDVTPNLSQ